MVYWILSLVYQTSEGGKARYIGFYIWFTRPAREGRRSILDSIFGLSDQRRREDGSLHSYVSNVQKGGKKDK